jgi:hypothetical protein
LAATSGKSQGPGLGPHRPNFWGTAAGRFIKKYDLPPGPQVIQEVHCGLHSGFPDCCILFFVTFWASAPDAVRDFYADLVSNLAVKRPGYIPCPRCLLGGDFVEVKRCNRNEVRSPHTLCRPTAGTHKDAEDGEEAE